MKVEQYVMAYGAEQDRLRAICRTASAHCGRCSASTRRSGTATQDIWDITPPW